MMSEQDFIRLISAYGGKPENWPAESRAAMQAYCRETRQAEALLGREKSLDDWLDSRLPEADDALEARLMADMNAALDTVSADIIPLLASRVSRRVIASGLTALAACFVGGFIAAPVAIDMLTGGADLLASLDIISDVFLPIEPL